MLVTDEFLEHVQEDALSVEVWGHRSMGFGGGVSNSCNTGDRTSWEVEDLQKTKSKTLQDRLVIFCSFLVLTFTY